MFQFIDSFPLVDTLGNPINLCDDPRPIYNPSNVRYDESKDAFYYNREPLLRTKMPNVNSSRGTFYKLQGTINKRLEFMVKHFKYEDEFADEVKAFNLLQNVDCKVIEGAIVSRKLRMIVMPSLDGDLGTFLKNPKLAPSIVASITIRLAEILKCLHSKKIVYTDIKPANVLYRCRGKNRFDMFLGDVGDIIHFEDSMFKKFFVASFPLYKVERKNYWDWVLKLYNLWFKHSTFSEACDWIRRKSKRNEINVPDFEVKMRDASNKEDIFKILKEGIDQQRNESIPYSDLIEPITDVNAEKHIVWGIVMFYFLLALPQNSLLTHFIESFWNGRNLSNEEFSKNVRYFTKWALRFMDSDWNEPLVRTILKAFRDPKQVTLNDIIKTDSTNAKDTSKSSNLKF